VVKSLDIQDQFGNDGQIFKIFAHWKVLLCRPAGFANDFGPNMKLSGFEQARDQHIEISPQDRRRPIEACDVFMARLLGRMAVVFKAAKITHHQIC